MSDETAPGTTTVNALLAFEILLFAAASLVHAGVVAGGFEHGRAATAEGVIAAVLAAGLAARLAWPRRAIALAVQAFALLGTLVGALTMIIGVGPQTVADRVFHVVLLAILVSGLVLILRRRG